MIDGFLNGLRRTGERVQRRGEEVAQSARLRVDVFQLGRELDALYARLGRAYHAQASVSTLEEIRAEITRVDEEIAARERLMAELGSQPQDAAEVVQAPAAETASVTLIKPESASVASSASPFAVPRQDRVIAPVVSPPDAAPTTSFSTTTPSDQPVAQTALSVWREKEASRMNDPETLKTGPTTDLTGRPDGPDADPTRTTGENSGGNPTIPNSDKHQVLGDKTAGVALEATRDKLFRHQHELEEGRRATEDPDPLASKD